MVIMNKGLDALEKIDHTVCLASLENKDAIFNKDKYDHCDCIDSEEYAECYEIIETELKNKYSLSFEISEMLVDYTKGNYADINTFINELREVLKKYE